MTSARIPEPLWRYRYLVLAFLGILLVGLSLWAERGWFGDVPVAGRLGPTPGPDAEGYLSEKRGHLTRLAAENPDEQAAALVSLERLLSAAEAEELASGMRVSVAFVTLPRSGPEAVPVEDGLRRTVAARVREAGEDVEGEWVYALVVSEVTIGRLAGLQLHPDVRLVDLPDPPVPSLQGWELTPLLPSPPP